MAYAPHLIIPHIPDSLPRNSSPRAAPLPSSSFSSSSPSSVLARLLPRQFWTGGKKGVVWGWDCADSIAHLQVEEPRPGRAGAV
jgi:hypothetical protein